MANISLTPYTNSFFGSFLKSPNQMGSLSINNSVTNISRLGTFKAHSNIFTATAHQISILGGRAGNRNRACRTASQCLTTIWATLHPIELRPIRLSYAAPFWATSHPNELPWMCDIFTVFESRYFYTTKSLWEGDFGAEIQNSKF